MGVRVAKSLTLWGLTFVGALALVMVRCHPPSQRTLVDPHGSPLTDVRRTSDVISPIGVVAPTFETQIITIHNQRSLPLSRLGDNILWPKRFGLTSF